MNLLKLYRQQKVGQAKTRSGKVWYKKLLAVDFQKRKEKLDLLGTGPLHFICHHRANKSSVVGHRQFWIEESARWSAVSLSKWDYRRQKVGHAKPRVWSIWI